MTISATEFELKYRRFLEVRSSWMDILNAHAQYHSVNSFGQKIRPICATSDRALISRAQEILNEWKTFAHYADTLRENDVTVGNKPDYSPIPSIITGPLKVSINEGSAQSIHNLTKEKIIHLLQRKKRLLIREGHTESPELIDTEYDLERFARYPDGTQFRRRLAGYSDTLITCHLRTGEDTTTRVGTWGAIVAIDELIKPLKYHAKGNKIESVYDRCTPIPCSLYDTGTIYLMKEVELAKLARSEALHPSTAYRRRKARALEELLRNTKPIEDNISSN